MTLGNNVSRKPLVRTKPIAFGAAYDPKTATVSWYVNSKPSIFGTLQLTLVMLRGYILWYFCRVTCTFESEQQ